MYQIIDDINQTKVAGFSASKLCNLNAKEILHISLEEGFIFPTHTTPRDATLLMLEGNVTFHINKKEYKLLRHQIFNFPKNTPHQVTAFGDSKFLIIR